MPVAEQTAGSDWRGCFALILRDGSEQVGPSTWKLDALHFDAT